MKEKLLKELKERLEREKVLIEEGLKKIAKKDEKLPGDWDTRFPSWNGEIGEGGLKKSG